MEKICIAAVQMVSSTNPETNIASMKRLVKEAAEQGAEWILLPEYWAILGYSDQDKVGLAEDLGHGVFQTALSEAAQENQVILFGGTIPLKSEEYGKVMNTMLVYNQAGERVGLYHKMHLFGFTDKNKQYDESATITVGNSIPKISIDGINVAVGVCYDLRFPEFFRKQLPFDVLLLPAAFTYTTGKAHWELLLRARAVENQCYVVASAQGGVHENGRHTFGHSMIIDPWGEVVAQLPEGEGMVIADLSMDKLHEVRQKLPALQHRIL